MHKFLLIALLTIASAAQAELITHNKADDNPKEQMVLDLLKLVLSKSGGSYEFKGNPEFLEEARAVEMLKKGSLSVVWMGTQRTYEEELRPIRMPIEKGMLGHRIFIIRKGDQHLFDNVKSLDDLKKLRGGQGRFWGDTAVLKAAGLNIVAPVKYSSLFPMLEGGRFDYFPRAVHEPWSEVKSHESLNLEVEKKVLLVYPFAMYFFVDKNNEALAKKIEDGFEAAIADGSYDKLFLDHPIVKDALAQSDLKNRVIIHLDNPNMSDKTPTNRPELWLDATKL